MFGPDNQNEDYPSRGESFSMGMMQGWNSVLKTLPFILIAVLIALSFTC